MRAVSLALGAWFSVASLASAQGSIRADSAEIRAAIERGARGFARAQPDTILAHYARDIVLSYPGMPDQDYAALVAAYGELRQRPSFVTATTNPTFDEILVSGNLAIVRVRWTTTIRAAAHDTVPARPGNPLPPGPPGVAPRTGRSLAVHSRHALSRFDGGAAPLNRVA